MTHGSATEEIPGQEGPAQEEADAPQADVWSDTSWNNVSFPQPVRIVSWRGPYHPVTPGSSDAARTVSPNGRAAAGG